MALPGPGYIGRRAGGEGSSSVRQEPIDVLSKLMPLGLSSADRMG